ncbi:MAG: hypothetical protein HY652_05340 [Acidobacteria bacterium]|nr:hypothetical protein [Acidobacteriota bacterium]
MRNLWLVPFLVAPLGAGTDDEIRRLQSDILMLQNQIRLLQKSYEGSAAANKSLLEQLSDQTAKSGVALQEMSQTITDGQATFKQDVQQLLSELRTVSLKLDETIVRLDSLFVQMSGERRSDTAPPFASRRGPAP